MTESRTSYISKIGAVLLMLMLFLSVSGCKKKVPPPPPPPPPVTNNNPPPPSQPRPVIAAFTAEPSTIEKGQSSTLSWSITGATDMSINNGIGAIQSRGQRQVFPAATTTYTLTANGPGGADTRSVTVTVSTAPPPLSTPSNPSLNGAEMLQREAQDAFFDYDKSDIRADARDALAHDAELLKKIFGSDPNFTAIIEGHCDERGSAEYNLALGDRRATAAKEYLVQLGVPAEKLKTISYGKERPQCTDASEACWQRNRRAHLVAGQ